MAEITHDDQVRVFAHQRWGDQIATLVPYGTNENGDLLWRLTVWAPNGPLGHSIFARPQLECELHWDWRESLEAGMVLESWSNTTEWSRGLKQCQFLAAWNVCCAQGRWDLCQMLDRTKTLDEALELIPRTLAMLENTQ